jgi:hypothetical protein
MGKLTWAWPSQCHPLQLPVAMAGACPTRPVYSNDPTMEVMSFDRCSSRCCVNAAKDHLSNSLPQTHLYADSIRSSNAQPMLPSRSMRQLSAHLGR